MRAEAATLELPAVPALPAAAPPRPVCGAILARVAAVTVGALAAVAVLTTTALKPTDPSAQVSVAATRIDRHSHRFYRIPRTHIRQPDKRQSAAIDRAVHLLDTHLLDRSVLDPQQHVAPRRGIALLHCALAVLIVVPPDTAAQLVPVLHPRARPR